ncbi:hypothetical protein EO763_13625 [Pectobacterium odoriferum]|uniref:hypothetical protein n=1 Tax=Pectobacterium odoriferum TaxID=78398 RepID=UPI001373DBF7|nr:hypothetical protein [Pectobacterium odoriferum]QHP80886.1 hypothetical protein EO763_13625 [Pectobacterium odoriferum]
MKEHIHSMPYLARFASKRTEENNIPGYYSSEQDVWVIEDGDKELPIIFKGCLPETLTKTNANQEGDDDTSYVMIELATKTAAELERDDTDLSMNHLLELVTKTDTIQERDDNNWGGSHLIELATKTFVAVERDEEFSFLHLLDKESIIN